MRYQRREHALLECIDLSPFPPGSLWARAARFSGPPHGRGSNDVACDDYPSGGVLILFVGGCSYSMLYTSQQHRLLSLAREHANVILSLNSLTLHLGVASGAALGGGIMHVPSILLPGWVGADCVLLAVLTLLLSIWHCAHTQSPLKSKAKRHTSYGFHRE